MKAQEIIQAFAAQVDGDLSSICAALQDGAALFSIGATDADQSAVEDAWLMVVDWMKAGCATLVAA